MEIEKVEDVNILSSKAKKIEAIQNLINIIDSIDVKILELRSETKKVKGVGFLQTIKKNLNASRVQMCKAMRIKMPKTSNSKNGFGKPVLVSDELCVFMGIPVGSLISKGDVTKWICAYVKKLQYPENKQILLVQNDPKLVELLKYDVANDKPLTYATIHKYMVKHYPKKNVEN